MNEGEVERSIYIEEAINIASGTRIYQKRVILILFLGCIAIAHINMCTEFFAPELVICDRNTSTGRCGKENNSTPRNDIIDFECLINLFYFEECEATDCAGLDPISKNSATFEFKRFQKQSVLFETWYGIGKLIGCLFVPFLIDKYGRKKVIKNACIICAFNYT